MRPRVRWGVHSLHGILIPLNAPKHDQLPATLHQRVKYGLLGGARDGCVSSRQPSDCSSAGDLADVQNVDHHRVAGETVHTPGVVCFIVTVVAVARSQAVFMLAKHVQLPLAVVHGIGADGRETRSRSLSPSDLHVGVGTGTGAAAHCRGVWGTRVRPERVCPRFRESTLGNFCIAGSWPLTVAGTETHPFTCVGLAGLSVWSRWPGVKVWSSTLGIQSRWEVETLWVWRLWFWWVCPWPTSQLPATEIQALDVLYVGILCAVKDGLLDDIRRPSGGRGENSKHSKPAPSPAPILPPALKSCHGREGQRGRDVGMVVGRVSPWRWEGVALWWNPHSVLLQLDVLGLWAGALDTTVLADEHCQAIHLRDKKEKNAVVEKTDSGGHLHYGPGQARAWLG